MIENQSDNFDNKESDIPDQVKASEDALSSETLSWLESSFSSLSILSD